MTVQTVTITSMRSGRTTQDGRTTTLKYCVTTNDNNDGPNVVSLSLPRIGDAYALGDEFDFGQRCTSVQIDDMQGDARKWSAEVRFASIHGEPGATERNTIGGSGGPIENDPVEREPIYGVRFERYQEPVVGDYDEAQANKLAIAPPGVFVNSAGQPFNPQPTKDATRVVFSVTTNEISLDPAELIELQDVVNSTAFGIFPARTLKLNIVSVQPFFEDGKERYKRVYELAHRKNSWDTAVQDEGVIKDAEGVVRRTLLDGAGVATNDPADITYITAKPYRLLDFNTDPTIPVRVRDFRNIF